MPADMTYSARTSETREPFSMKINPWLKYQAMRRAHEYGVSLSSVIEDALRVFLEAHPLDDREPNVR